MTYHLSEIEKQPAGSLDKIVEEVLEAKDAVSQGSHILLGVELSDTLLALQQAARSYGWDFNELLLFATITERAMESGRAQVPLSAHAQVPTEGRCREIAAFLERCDLNGWLTYGTGYAVIRFKGDYKLHVWHPIFVKEDRGGIHSHEWDLESTVLEGFLNSAIFKAETGDSEVLQSCCSDAKTCVDVREIGRFQIPAGTTYLESRGTLHEVIEAEGVTWVRKINRQGEAFYVDTGAPNPYMNPKTLSREELDIVREMMQKVFDRWIGE